MWREVNGVTFLANPARTAFQFGTAGISNGQAPGPTFLTLNGRLSSSTTVAPCDPSLPFHTLWVAGTFLVTHCMTFRFRFLLDGQETGSLVLTWQNLGTLALSNLMTPCSPVGATGGKDALAFNGLNAFDVETVIEAAGFDMHCSADSFTIETVAQLGYKANTGYVHFAIRSRNFVA